MHFHATVQITPFTKIHLNFRHFTLHYSSVLAFQISEQCLKNSKGAKMGLSTHCAFKIVTTVSNWKRILWVSLCLSQSVSVWTCACDWLCEKALFFLAFLCLNHKTHYLTCQMIYFIYCNCIFILIALMNKTKNKIAEYT